MGYNIKHDQTDPLASEPSRPTGTKVADAGAKALRDRLERERRVRGAEKRLREMRAIADRCARLLASGPPPIKHGDKPYNDRGLPR